MQIHLFIQYNLLNPYITCLSYLVSMSLLHKLGDLRVNMENDGRKMLLVHGLIKSRGLMVALNFMDDLTGYNEQRLQLDRLLV